MSLDLLSPTIFAFFLVFARVGAILMLIPGIGEAFVPTRVRLAIALALSFAIFPFVRETLPAIPGQPVQILLLLITEITIGVFIGASAKLLMSALHVAGMVISFQSSLGFAQFYDPAQQAQGAIISSFMTILGLLIIFAADLHHLMLRASYESYEVFPPAILPATGDFASLAARSVANAFSIGLQISAPFIIYALILYLGMGLLNRLMPQMQVFFIVMPLNILLSMVFLAITIGAALTWFGTYFNNAIGMFLGGA